MLKQFSEAELFGKPLSEEQKQELISLSSKPDDEIDLSDIPEIDFSKGLRGLSYRGPTIRLREDLRKYFADLAEARQVPLNDLVNDTLAKAIGMP